MPAAHLTTASPHEVAAGVLDVLAGADPATTAAGLGMDPADLADAIQRYQAAGLAALEQRDQRDWHDLRIRFPDWHTAETSAAIHLGPRLDQLHADQAIARWWFLRKHPCWRIRLHHADTAAVAHILDELTTAGVLTGWWPTIYEPETAAFGGPAGTHLIHDLFCVDSKSVLDYTRQAMPTLGRRETSLLLINALQTAAGLDRFERGDVFDRIARLRPAPADTDRRIDELATKIGTLLATSTEQDVLTAPDGPAAFARPWLAAFTTTGHQLGEAAGQGSLNRGLRAVLTHIVMFHWNRLGLSATTQGVLAHAARAATLPRS